MFTQRAARAHGWPAAAAWALRTSAPPSWTAASRSPLRTGSGRWATPCPDTRETHQPAPEVRSLPLGNPPGCLCRHRKQLQQNKKTIKKVAGLSVIRGRKEENTHSLHPGSCTGCAGWRKPLWPCRSSPPASECAGNTAYNPSGRQLGAGQGAVSGAPLEGYNCF